MERKLENQYISTTRCTRPITKHNKHNEINETVIIEGKSSLRGGKPN